MARREGERGQLGLAFVDDEVFWAGPPNAPTVRNQSASDFAPTGAAFASVGSYVIGLGVMTASVTDRAMRPPSDLRPSGLGNAFEFRYAGVAGNFQRDTVTLGVARRIGDNVALGVALGASRVTVGETRRLWAGFSGRDVLGDPELDIETVFAGTDWFAPSIVAGVLFASTEAPIELGASVGWMQTVTIRDADTAAFSAGTAMAPRVMIDAPSASLRIRQPVAARAGARYIGERFVAELGGDLWLAPNSGSATTWRVTGVRIADRTGVSVPLDRVPSRISMRTHGAIRTSVDAELIGGFLWATAGYAFQTAGVAETRQSPTFADLGGHTFGLGLEGTAGGFTFTLGWSRTWAIARRTATSLALDNPFATGDRLVPVGTYDGSIDQIGILVDAEWEAPD